jgi:death-on-curing protein
MKYLKLEQILHLHQAVISQSGGSDGIRDQGALESAGAQPMMTFDGMDLYPDIVTRVAPPGYSLIQNHSLMATNELVTPPWKRC